MSEAVEAIKLILWIWSNTTSHLMKRLHTDNGGECNIRITTLSKKARNYP